MTTNTLDATAERATTTEPLYADADFYDRLVCDDDSSVEVAFYASMAGPASAMTLELGCGTGRLTLPLAETGHRLTGIDNSSAMLAVARRKARGAPKVSAFVLADVRSFALRSRFQLIMFAQNSLGHLHTLGDLLACLRCVRAHLADDGLFVIDIFNPFAHPLAIAPQAQSYIGSYVDKNGSRVAVTETSRYDAAAQIQERVWRHASTDGRETVINFCTRVFFPQELEALLRRSGFSIRAKYGSFAKEPFAEDSSQQLLVCGHART
jgi:SAM-dependent methyltransferase